MLDPDKRIIEELKKSPLFNLSLSSKELFHSNFLAWIGNNYKGIFENLLKELCGVNLDGDWQVEREHLHFDLCITKEKRNEKKRGKNKKEVIFVLENKVKSIPTLTQLQDYDKHIPHNAEKVLLSLATDFPDRDGIISKNWKIIDYSDLERELRKVINEFPNDYFKNIVCDYCNFILNLHEVANTWTVKLEDKYIRENRDIYDSIRIADLYDKIWYSKLFTELNKALHSIIQPVKVVPRYDIGKIKKDSDAPLEKVFTNWDFTRNQGFIEAKVKINNRYVLLIQVQGNQYRHGIEWISSESISSESKTADAYWKNTQEERIIKDLNFFEFEYDEKFERIKSNLKFNRYNDCFLYKAKKISKNATVNDIINSVTEDIENIINTAKLLKGI